MRTRETAAVSVDRAESLTENLSAWPRRALAQDQPSLCRAPSQEHREREEHAFPRLLVPGSSTFSSTKDTIQLARQDGGCELPGWAPLSGPLGGVLTASLLALP